jgi:hypothetical protein
MHFLWKQGGSISWGKDAKFRDFTENMEKSAFYPNRKAIQKSPKWPILIGDTPFWGNKGVKNRPF